MGRLVSNEFHYIGLETGWYELQEHELLEARFGLEGLFLWQKFFLSCFALNGYYISMTEDNICIYAKKRGVTVQFIHELLDFLCDHNMVNASLLYNEHILTSRTIQLRFQAASKDRGKNRSIEVNEDYWLLDETETAPYIIPFSGEHFSEQNSTPSRNKSDSFGNKTDSSRKNDDSFFRKEKKRKDKKRKESTGEEMTGKETHPRVRFTPTPLAYRRRYRAARERKKMTGQSISQRCESLRRIYEETCGDLLPHQQSVNPDTHYPLIRQGMLRGYTTADYRKVFDAVKQSRFLQGENGRFRATFGWLINPEKMKKVLAGEYEDYAGVGGKAKGNKKNPAVAEEETWSSFDTDEFFNAALRRSYEIHGYPSAE